MYPLCAWSYDELAGRLDQLFESGFLHETVVVTYQVTEQCLRRVVLNYMNKTGRGFIAVAPPGKGKEIGPLLDMAQREQAKHLIGNGLGEIRDSWKKLVKPSCGISLPQTLDRVAGNAAWLLLYSKEFRQPRVIGANRVRHGLRGMRNKVVHDTVSPSRRELEILAGWGVYLVKTLLNPESGLAGVVGYNPQCRTFPFRPT